MNKLVLLILLAGIHYSSYSQTNYYSGRPAAIKSLAGLKKGDYKPNTAIVKFKGSPSAGARAMSLTPQLDLKSATIEHLVNKFPGKSSRSVNTTSAEADPIGLDRIYELKFSGGAGMENVINELLSKKNVEYAEPAYIHHANYTSNDPFYLPRQGYLAQVKAPAAWDFIRNSSGVIIGIVDTGSELDHEDLSVNIIGGRDLIGASADNIMEDDDPDVKNSASEHGIHVSGLASAVANNNKGISSIAFNAKLLIVKVSADNTPDDIYNGYEGIQYAVDHGAKIINCSWGSSNRSQYGEDIINYAIGNDCLVIAAAGNQGSENPEYPAAYKGVLAVASVMDNDVKASSSNFGGYVSIAAPGNSVYSTTFRDGYGYKSGTSMATPIVSSAAALVKTYLPELSMTQVGELLRVTADNIDPLNSRYTGKLGKGRLNVYRALMENQPSLRSTAIRFDDHQSGNFRAGSVIDIMLDIKNYLLKADGSEITLKSSNKNVLIEDATHSAGSLGTMETKTGIGPFKVTVRPGTPENTPVEFTIEYRANNGNYTDAEVFTLVVARDYFNIITADLATTATSIGKIGYQSAAQADGLGFVYKGKQLLYESSLMIGLSPSVVSNNARTSEGNIDAHFSKKQAITEVSTDDEIIGRALFDDSGNGNGLSVDVKNVVKANRSIEKDNYIITEYEVSNKGTTDLANVYIGVFTDWDINGGSSNFTAYDAIDRVGYVYSTASELPYAGVKFLSASPAVNYYPLSLAEGFLNDDNFTTSEKFQTLSSGIKSVSPGNAGNGQDVSFVTGYGPILIPANGAVKFAFAYIGADDLESLKVSARSAQADYDVLQENSDLSQVLTSYPNPVTSANNNNMSVQIRLPDDARMTLEMYSLRGQKVSTLIKEQAYFKGTHTFSYNLTGTNPGIYILRLNFNGKSYSHKIRVLR